MYRRTLQMFQAVSILLVLAVFCWGQSQDTLKMKAEADNLVAQARALAESGQFSQNVINLYQSALGIYQEIGDRNAQALTYGNMGYVYLYTREYSDALSSYENKLRLDRELGNRQGECDALGRIGSAYMCLHQESQAKEYLQKSLKHAQELKDYKLEYRSLYGLGQACVTFSELETGIDYLKQSLTIAREKGLKMEEGIASFQLGTAYTQLGFYAKALEFLENCLAMCKDEKKLMQESICLNSIGNVYHYMFQHLQAKEYYQESLEISREIGNPGNAMLALGNIGNCYRRLNNLPKALDNYRQTLEIAQEIEDKETICTTYENMGSIYAQQQQSDSAFAYLREALAIARELDLKSSEAGILRNMGGAHIKLGGFMKAEQSLVEALSIAQEEASQDLIRDCLQSLAYFYENREQDSLALVYYQKCIENSENIRGQLDIESQKSSYTAGTSEIYESPILLLLKSNQSSAAFHYAERARARSFLDLLASAQVKVGKPEHQEFLAKENQYLDQKEETEQQIGAAGEDTAQVVALRGKLEGDWGEVLASLEEQKREEPELASLVSVNPLTLPEVQKLLDKETTLLEYFLTEKKTLIWLVTHKNSEVFQMDIGGDSLKALVMGFRKAIQEQGKTGELAGQLYDLLIGPAANKIKTDNLIIVPHGMLHYLPFAALQDHNGRCLLEDYRIRYLPSASVLKYLPSKRRARGEILLALGNPTTARKGFAGIPLTETEVREIGNSQPNSQILTGAQATEAEFKRLAPHSDILHLACHGDLNSAYPMFSCLLLTPDSSEDGELAVHEIFNLDLNASLVVLSGCQTGLGHLTNGDELVGLSRAFIYAGTPSIVSSLWMVEDESTAYLMGRFYHYLRDRDKAEALRKAQLETRQKYPGLRSWASFVLTGEAM